MFHGERMNGRYALFRTGGKDWMIHRMDPPADPGREPMPERLQPMLAAHRATAARRRGALGLRGQVGRHPRAGLDRGRPRAPVLAQRQRHHLALPGAARRWGGRWARARPSSTARSSPSTPSGRPSFERLQSRMHLANEAAVRRAVRDIPDRLRALRRPLPRRAHDVRAALPERRALLEGLALRGPHWQTPGYRTKDAEALLRVSAERGLEGVVAKRLDSRYEPGRRATGWVKVKNVRHQSVVIGGWLPGEGRRARRSARCSWACPARTARSTTPGGWAPASPSARCASCRRGWRRCARDHVAVHRPQAAAAEEPGVGGAQARRRGRVRRVDAHAHAAGAVVQGPARRHRPGPDRPRGGGERRRWRRSSRRCREVRNERRHATRRGSRSRSAAARCRCRTWTRSCTRRSGSPRARSSTTTRGSRPTVLPHLRDRPLTLKRYPDGVDGEYFYEKQSPGHRPAWVQTAALWSRHNKRTIEYALAQDLPTLVWLANLADIELHTSLSLASDVTQPTMLVFDLDPGAPAAMLECAQVALWVRDLFGQLGLETLREDVGFQGPAGLRAAERRRDLRRRPSRSPRPWPQLLEKQHPELVVSSMAKERRKGKVLVDWSQNDEHKTTVNVVLAARARTPDGLDAAGMGGGRAGGRGRRRRRAGVHQRRRARPRAAPGRPVRPRARARAGAAGAQRLSVTAPAPRRRARAGPRRGARARPGRPRRRGWTWARCGWRRGR